MWRSGKVTPGRTSVRWLAVALGLPLDELAEAAEAQREHTLQRADTGESFSRTPSAHTHRVDSSEVERREFTRLGLLGVAGLATNGVDLERWGAVLAGTRVDARSLDDQRQIGQDLMRRSWTAAPQALLPAVRGHLDGFRDILLWAPLKLAPEAYTLAGEIALLAGHLALKLDQRDQADAFWTLADRFADTAGNGELRANVLVLWGWRWHDGDNQARAFEVFDHASGLIGSGHDAFTAALTFSSRAYEHADAHQKEAAMHDMEAAEAHLGRLEQADASRYIIEDIESEVAISRARCLLQLDRAADAVRELDRILAGMEPASKSARSMVLVELAAAQAKLGEIELACAVLHDALHLAYEASAPYRAQRVLATRQQWLAGYDTPALRHLDEELQPLAG
jgi:tetratricopeptide (TPR) repeat protein